MELFRSLLFVPGNRQDMLEKVVGLSADVLVPDMEDSVPESEKATARHLIADMLPRLAQEGRRVVVRVNALDSGLLEEDLEAAVTAHTYGVNVGKVERPWDVQQVEYLLNAIETRKGLERGKVKLILFIESALAVTNAYVICSSSPRVIAVAFGAEDFTVDMGVERTDEASEVFTPRAMVAIAARAANVLPLDMVYANFRDENGLRRDIQAGRNLGYKGKFAIHPSQIEPINSMYSPMPEEVEYASRVIEVFKQAVAQGRGATSLDGHMVDIPVVKRAERLLDIARAISERQNR